MTREEVIAILENEKKCVNRANKNDYCNRDCYNCELVKTDTEILTALDMAIKALEQEPTKREIEREYLFQSLCEDFKKLQAENDDLRKRLEQEPCEDAISREAVLNCLTATGLKKYDFILDARDKIKNLPSVRPQEPFNIDTYCKEHFCVMVDKDVWEKAEKALDLPWEDAISRRALLEEIENGIKAGNYEEGYEEYSHINDMDDIIECIKYADSIQPKPKTGHWIRMKAYEKWGCSECSTVFRFTFKEHYYCPNCGAKMEGEV